ncbi:MAG: UbiA family prenyltransferase [Phycisphaerae bacterium]|nr:UbiA family prenyltransferase [Phycisphaerae bacterium]
MSTLKTHCELVRLPNLFTAAADILAGYYLVTGELHVSWTLLLLIAASCCLYATGIVTNDLRDVELDRLERPNRPLPSGRVSPTRARWIARMLAVAGVLTAALAWSPTELPAALTIENRAAACALVLLASILAYNFLLKQTPLGPIAMGVCRVLNLGMAMSIARFSDEGTRNAMFAIAGAFGLYVTALTYFGREETGAAPRRHLVIGLGGMVTALVVIGALAIAEGDSSGFNTVIWLATVIHIFRVGLRTIRRPTPNMVQYAMKTFILAIIAVDAVIAGTTAGTPAVLVTLALLVPAATIGRWVYST